MLAPDLVGHGRGLHRDQAPCSSRSDIIERPLDLDWPSDRFGLAHHARERDSLGGIPGQGGDKIAGDGLRRRIFGRPVEAAPRVDAAQESLPGKHDPVGHHLALGNGGAQSPGRADQHLPLCGLAQAAARGTRIDQRLDEHGHGGCSR
jgi:hypothetical protein